MQDFHERIEAILSRAIETKKTQIPTFSLDSLPSDILEYKIKTMPDENGGQPVALCHKSSVLSESGEIETITRLQLVTTDFQALIATIKDKGDRVIYFDAGNFRRYFEDLACVTVNQTFAMTDCIDVIDWFSAYNEVYSAPSVVENYNKIHQNISDEVLIYLRKLLKETSERPILLNLIDAGCGKSDLLRTLRVLIRERFPKEIVLRDFGFDMVADNITYLSQEDPAGHYAIGDARSTDEVFAKAKKSGWLFNDKGHEEKMSSRVHSLMVTSGVLTRRVLDVAKATRALQSIYHAGVDAIICSGVNNATFNEYTSKRLGFKMTRLQGNQFPVYLLEPLSPQLICQRKTTSFVLNKNSILDLSSCPVPAYVLQNFAEEHRSKVKILNLSFCKPCDIPETRLKALVKSYPNLHTIIMHQSSGSELYNNIFYDCPKIKLIGHLAERKNPLYPQLGAWTISNEAYFMSEKILKQVFGLSQPGLEEALSNEAIAAKKFQYMIIGFSGSILGTQQQRPYDYYHSKNNIINALNTGEYRPRNILGRSFEELQKATSSWRTDYRNPYFFVKVSEDLEGLQPGEFISIEQMIHNKTMFDSKTRKIEAIEIEFNFTPPIVIQVIPKLDRDYQPSKALLSYAHLLKACGYFADQDTIRRTIVDYAGAEPYPLKEDDTLEPGDTVKVEVTCS